MSRHDNDVYFVWHRNNEGKADILGYANNMGDVDAGVNSAHDSAHYKAKDLGLRDTSNTVLTHIPLNGMMLQVAVNEAHYGTTGHNADMMMLRPRKHGEDVRVNTLWVMLDDDKPGLAFAKLGNITQEECDKWIGDPGNKVFAAHFYVRTDTVEAMLNRGSLTL